MARVSSPECIANPRCRLGEAALWHGKTGRLYWLDISLASTLFEWDAASGRMRHYALGELATGLAHGPDGIVIVSEGGPALFHPDRPIPQRIAVPPFSMQGMRFNDCGCDRQGRLWTGTMVNDLRPHETPARTSGEICRFDHDGSCHVLAKGVGCPNTFAWSLDERTLYTADSATGRFTAYDFDAQTGSIREGRPFGEPAPGIPDGSAMDEEGCLWNARWGAGCVVRFTPGGKVDTVVSIPATFVTSCAFGGAGLDTLFVTTALRNDDEKSLAREPYAGGVFAFRPQVRGIPPSAFLYQRLLGN